MRKEVFCEECNEDHYEGQLYHTQRKVWEKHNESLTLEEFEKLDRKGR